MYSRKVTGTANICFSEGFLTLSFHICLPEDLSIYYWYYSSLKKLKAATLLSQRTCELRVSNKKSNAEVR